MGTRGDPSEEELVRRVRDGDAEALCRLFDRYEHLLRRRIQRHLPPHLRRRVSVADILQESRVVALDRRLAFEARGENAFRNWILGIAEKKTRRAVQWHGRVQKRAAGREVTRAHRMATGRFASEDPSPSEVAIGAELTRLTGEALASLPSHYQEVLRLSREEQLPLTEVAVRMRRSHGATKKLYGRALHRLAQELRRRGGIRRA